MKGIRNYFSEHRFMIRGILRLYVRLWIGCIVIACSLTFSVLSAVLLLISVGYMIGRLVLRRKLAGFGRSKT